jgi:hypothetical protein
LAIHRIRHAIARLPMDGRPVLSRDGGTLILDYGIYQERCDLRSFRIDVNGANVGGTLRHAEQLASNYQDSPSHIERDAARDCIGISQFLRDRLHDIDAFGDGRVVAERITVREFCTIIKLGRLIERLDKGLPHQRRALTGARKAKRNARIARENALTDEELRRRYQAVQVELTLQARRGQRINREQAYRTVAERMDLTPGMVKKSCLEWQRRAG